MAYRSSTNTSGVGTDAPSGNKPAGTAADDILLAFIVTEGATSIINTPAGWNWAASTYNTTFSGQTVHVYWLVASGSEPTTYDWQTDVSANWVVLMGAWSGRDTTLDYSDVTLAFTTVDDTSYASPITFAGYGGDTLVGADVAAFGQLDHTGGTSDVWTFAPGASWTERKDVSPVDGISATLCTIDNTGWSGYVGDFDSTATWQSGTTAEAAYSTVVVILPVPANASVSGQTITARAELRAGTATDVVIPYFNYNLTSTLWRVQPRTLSFFRSLIDQRSGTAGPLFYQTEFFEAAQHDETVNGATLTATTSLIDGSAEVSQPATADGATITVTSSLIAGAAEQGPDAPTTPTITATASLIAGAAGTSYPATANGTTFTRHVSLAVGTRTASSSPAGQTVTATASLIAGTANSGGGATASGDTITDTASLLAGTATASYTHAGSTLMATASLLAGTATAADADASGALITVTASLIPGSHSAAVAVDGATLAATASLIAGEAGNATVVPGVTFTQAASLLTGAGEATSTVDGTTVTATASLLAGTAYGSYTYVGSTITAAASLLAGSVTASSEVAGQTFSRNATLLAGSVQNVSDASAGAHTIVATGTLLAGAVTASSTVAGQVLVVPITFIPPQNYIVGGTLFIASASITPGTASGEFNGVGGAVLFNAAVSLLAGTAQSESIVDGVVRDALVDFIAGSVSADSEVEGVTLTSNVVYLYGHHGYWLNPVPVYDRSSVSIVYNVEEGTQVINYIGGRAA